MSFPTQVPNARLVHQFSNRRQWAGSERQKSERGLKLQGFQPFHRRGPKPNIIAARPLRAERHVFATRFCLFVCLFVCLSVCFSAQMKSRRFFCIFAQMNSIYVWISPDFSNFSNNHDISKKNLYPQIFWFLKLFLKMWIFPKKKFDFWIFFWKCRIFPKKKNRFLSFFSRLWIFLQKLDTPNFIFFVWIF